MEKIFIGILLTMVHTLAQDLDCDFRQNVGSSEKYYIYNPDYPGYHPGRVCRYIATCPVGYNCRLDCDVYMPQSKIVGGTTAMENEFPMMAAIMEKSIKDLYCGGVIISDRYILTAAHCLYKKIPKDFYIMVGSRNISAGGKRYEIQSFTIHRNFNENTLDYDIGLVQLQKPLQFSNSVKPVCLPFKYVNRDFTGLNVTVLGWGTLFFGGPKPELLHKVDMSVISRAKCRASTKQQICTYTSGKDACQNDSGGPLLYMDPTTGLLFIVGVVSSGVQCASTDPAYNTDVTVLLEWVLNNAQSSFCIKK